MRDLKFDNCVAPSALDLDDKGIYYIGNHSFPSHFPIVVAVRFWNAGFRNLEDHYNDGLTPLLDSWLYLDSGMMSWLIAKGASPYSKHRDNGGSGLHLCAFGLKRLNSFRRVDLSTICINEDLVSQLQMENSAQKDSCSCLCCPGGRTPYVTFLGKGTSYGLGGDSHALCHQCEHIANVLGEPADVAW